MNIKEAKEQLTQTIITYLATNEYGEYKIPHFRQRPVFLSGPPGIGKTAVVKEIAAELGIGMLSYSMIHHTRQSALGLPYIVQKNYDGFEVSVSEYTMSEIIASVYDLMEETHIRKGILFLDEVNCVSETLAPAMLQFLQFKTFGRHRLPEGWVVVTAGNPREYNKTARAFDVVTLDRLKVMELSPDLEAWKEYGLEHHIHPSVLSYLETKPGDFCRVETTIDGKAFVTPRGWDDLSLMLWEYEEHRFTIDEDLISQYVRNPVIAKDFTAYYHLYIKYAGDYGIKGILDGSYNQETLSRAKEAAFDERLSLISLMVASLLEQINTIQVKEDELTILKEFFRGLKAVPADLLQQSFGDALEKYRDRLEKDRKAGAVSHEKYLVRNNTLRLLDGLYESLWDNCSDFSSLEKWFNSQVGEYQKLVGDGKEALEKAFEFVEKAFGSGKEMLIFVTELTLSKSVTSFIGSYGCIGYFRNSKDLLLENRLNKLDMNVRDYQYDGGENE